MLFAVAVLAIRLGTVPDTVLAWDEFYFLAWLRLIEEAAQHIGRNDALRVSLAVWSPQSLDVRHATLPVDVVAEKHKGLTRAAEIVALHERIERRKRDARSRRR